MMSKIIEITGFIKHLFIKGNYMANTALQIDSPYVTRKVYSDITGMSVRVIDTFIARGEIPIMPKRSKNATVLINMVALFKQADEQEH